jgi:uncharacterized protein YqgC (DUF456 family)
VLAWLYYVLIVIISIIGLFLNLLGLPGLWLIVASLGIYWLLTRDYGYVGWPSLITLVVLGLLAEILEFLAGAAGSKAAGGRKRGMMGAVVGALVGGIAFSFVPIPVVATIVGAVLGAFVGAALMELTDRDFRHAMRVGYGAAKGRLMGIVVKTAIGVVMLLVLMFAAIPIGAARPQPVKPPPVPPSASTAPSMLPTSTSAPSPLP